MREWELDDFGGLEDLQESLRLALEHCSPFELGRIYNNLAWAYVATGRAAGSARDVRGSSRDSSALRAASRRALGRGDAVRQSAYLLGDWDATLRLVDELLADPLARHEHETALTPRAAIRLGRDELPGAWADVECALELTAGTEDLEERACVLATGVRVALAADRRSDAEALAGELDQILGDVLAREVWAANTLFELACALHALGRPLDPLVNAAASHPGRVWHRAAAALAQGGTAEAVELLAGAGAETYAAHFRLLLADQLVAAGRAVDAAAERERALEFFRSVGALRYIREGEAVLGPDRALPR